MENDKKIDKYLPIGSVVLLKNAKKKLMITGFFVVTIESPDKTFDYSGCLYPEGMISSKESLVFNHEQIEKIFSLGYSDEEEVEFKKELEKTIIEINNQNKE